MNEKRDVRGADEQFGSASCLTASNSERTLSGTQKPERSMPEHQPSTLSVRLSPSLLQAGLTLVLSGDSAGRPTVGVESSALTTASAIRMHVARRIGGWSAERPSAPRVAADSGSAARLADSAARASAPRLADSAARASAPGFADSAARPSAPRLSADRTVSSARPRHSAIRPSAARQIAVSAARSMGASAPMSADIGSSVARAVALRSAALSDSAARAHSLEKEVRELSVEIKELRSLVESLKG